MAEFDNTNTLTVNKNDKGDNEKRPDHRAKINIDGVVYWGSLWVRNGSQGTFLSGPVEKAEDKYQPGAASAPESAQEASSDDAPEAKQDSYF
jgi:hypothetical protein